MTYSETADKVIYYIDGSPTGATDTGLGAWAGNLLSTTCVVGADDTGGAKSFNGNMAHIPVWDSPLAAPQIAELATV